MVDAAVWCDFFARCDSPSSRVARATAYLFKVPEGGAKGVDPGFHRQMNELESALQEATSTGIHSSDTSLLSLLEKAVATGIITSDQAESLKALK
jgi:hypothetical protein